jgi:hypothetical protein
MKGMAWLEGLGGKPVSTTKTAYFITEEGEEK